jgi:hypothetical protein
VSTARPWRLAGAAVLAAGAVIAACSSTVSGQPRLRPAPRAGPELTESQLPALLLTDAQVGTIMGANNLKTYDTYTKMPDGRGASYTGDPSCQAALWNTIEPAYHHSGYLAATGRKVAEPGDTAAHDTDEGVVLFKTADSAQRQVDRSMVTWQQCAGRHLGYQIDGSRPQIWSVGIPAEAGPAIVVRNSEEAGDGYVCQHAMTARGNVVIDAFACGRDVTDQGLAIVNDIAAKVRGN